MPHVILHIIAHTDWAAAQHTSLYHGDTLATEGFIHCSTPAQVIIPANAFYHGRADLLLLVIDPARLTAPLLYEDTAGSGQAFPHLYGPLNLDAVQATVAFPPQADGTFVLPLALRGA